MDRRVANPRRRVGTALVAVMASLAAIAISIGATATPASTGQPPIARDATTGATGTSTASAGLITGRVTGPNGQPLQGISVVAAPAGNDTQLTQGATDANGNYALVVAPGSYDIAFNALDPVNSDYAAQVYGGPGPSASDACQVCGGQPQVVTNGAITAGINAVLAPPMQKGTIRPLSGNTIKVLANRISFRFGCHEDGIGCVGKGVLRIGSTRSPVVWTVHFQVQSNRTSTLHFTIPGSVRARLKRAPHNALPAVVQLTTVPSSTTTKFTLVQRP
ncbi:MAG: Carboxypeptidase regulatory-like domain [Solirubrobacteraceae bacterium]|jgi:hypothetical protein|nr:Carboxypeptidase regulatory-like domain [Solirubrobacteraceae bacterium]